jgi:hypothetical protein
MLAQLAKIQGALQKAIVLVALICLSSTDSFSQAPQASSEHGIANGAEGGQAGSTVPVDSIPAIIKARAIADLRHLLQTSDPETPENKAMAAKMKTWPAEKHDRFMEFFESSINKYILKLKFEELDAATFLYILSEFKPMDDVWISEAYDIRIMKSGKDYIAEFWEDGLDQHSEKLAIKNAANPKQVETIKERYEIVRAPIRSGKNPRYTKMMALLYTTKADGSVVFVEPFRYEDFK